MKLFKSELERLHIEGLQNGERNTKNHKLIIDSKDSFLKEKLENYEIM